MLMGEDLAVRGAMRRTCCPLETDSSGASAKRELFLPCCDLLLLLFDSPLHFQDAVCLCLPVCTTGPEEAPCFAGPQNPLLFSD